MKKRLGKILCFAVACMMAASGCSGNAEESGETVPVQSVSILAGLGGGLQNRYAGKVVSQETLELKKEENKTIKEVFVQAGDEVKAGQKLFAYDSDEISLSIDQAKLELEKLENSITTMEKQVEELEKEKKKAASSEKLSYTIEIQSVQAEIKQAEYNINAKKIEIERLEKSLENAEVTSTIDGVVQSINENGYDNYGNPLPYMVVMQTGNYRVKGTINEQNVGQLPVGSPVILRSRVDESQTWNGVIEKVDLDAAESGNSNNNGYVVSSSSGGGEMTQSSKYPFYITLENGDGLMLGQHIYIELDVGQEDKKEGIWLSSYYIIQDGDNAYVWAANEKDKLEKRKVTLGMRDDAADEFQITEGLTAQDYIAIPADNLKEGLSVTKYDDGSFGGGMNGGDAGAASGMEGGGAAEPLPGGDGLEGDLQDGGADLNLEGSDEGAAGEEGGEMLPSEDGGEPEADGGANAPEAATPAGEGGTEAGV